MLDRSVTHSTTLPRRRTLQLSVQAVSDETLVYDELRHTALCLNPVATAVWNCCDGTQTAAQIAASATLALGFPVLEEVVMLTLADLLRDQLLEPEFIQPPTLSRRHLIAKLGTGVALALPAIALVMAPTAAQAYNGCVDCMVTGPTQAQKMQALSLSQKQQTTALPTSDDCGSGWVCRTAPSPAKR